MPGWVTISSVRFRAAAWHAVAVAALAALLAGCTDDEPRPLRLTLRVDPTMPAFDYVQVWVVSYQGGNQIQSEDFRLAPADLDATGGYSTILFIPQQAEAIDVLCEVHAGDQNIGHGRRSVVTLDSQGYDLEVEVVPHPPYLSSYSTTTRSPRPRPNVSGWYISSAFGGGTTKVPGGVARGTLRLRAPAAKAGRFGSFGSGCRPCRHAVRPRPGPPGTCGW